MGKLRAVEPSEPKPATGIALTLGQCLAAEQAFAALAKQPVGPKLAYKVSKWLRLLAPETKQFEEQRVELAKRHGATEEQPVPKDNMADYVKDVSALAETAIDPINYPPLTMDELEKFPSICADDITRLGPCLAE